MDSACETPHDQERAPFTTRTSVQVTKQILRVILNQYEGVDGSQDRLQEDLTDQRLAIIRAKKLKAEEHKKRTSSSVTSCRHRCSPPLTASHLGSCPSPLRYMGAPCSKVRFASPSPCGTVGIRQTCNFTVCLR